MAAQRSFALYYREDRKSRVLQQSYRRLENVPDPERILPCKYNTGDSSAMFSDLIMCQSQDLTSRFSDWRRSVREQIVATQVRHAQEIPRSSATIHAHVVQHQRFLASYRCYCKWRRIRHFPCLNYARRPDESSPANKTPRIYFPPQ